MEFIKYPKVNDALQGSTLYEDVVTHCQNYKNFWVEDSKITTCHETTHGCNSEIRNAAGGNVNGFYLGLDRAIIIPEPAIRKRDCIPYIPSAVRGFRYNTYITGQTAWDNQPLYVFDEYVSYVNAVWAAVELKRKENWIEAIIPVYPYRVDGVKTYPNYTVAKGRIIEGSIEFTSYAVAILMAADNANSLQPLLVEFSKWMLVHSYNSYFESQKDFAAFDEQEKIYKEQKTGQSWASQRDFLRTKIGFVIPDGPTPNDPLDWFI